MYTGPVPHFWSSFDVAATIQEYCPPPLFFERIHKMPRAALRAVQEKRFLELMERGWKIPFFKRHWQAAGLEPGDIRSLADLKKLPPYDVDDIRKSIESKPPWGDFLGIDPTMGMPMVLQTSGGTTGLPRPQIYAPRDREIMGILGGRRLAMHGVQPGDVVQSTYSLNLSNGGFAAREALWKYSGALPVMTGSGNATPTRRQIEIMKAWGVNVLLGFPSYVRHLAQVARDEMGIEPRSLNLKLIGSHIGMEDRAGIEELWGARCQDMYGTNEAGVIACDCDHRMGMHVQEDATIVEIIDPETGKDVPDGERGTIYLTTLFKHYGPQIRFNINDISAWMAGECACGGSQRRIERIFGRGDNMVKLRGVNIFPEAIGALVAEDARATGEYFCIVDRVGASGREEMTVLVEVRGDDIDRASLQAALEARFKDALGVKIEARPMARGELDPFTGVSQTSKIKRLLDKRRSATDPATGAT
ncbi:MAG: phenylacetate--CoA ligase family protein [Hyphomicrobiaceae bacterium]